MSKNIDPYLFHEIFFFLLNAFSIHHVADSLINTGQRPRINWIHSRGACSFVSDSDVQMLINIDR